MGPERRIRNDQGLDNALDDSELQGAEPKAPNARADKSESDMQIQRAAEGGGGFEAGKGIENQIVAAESGGQALPADVRETMEQRFGADFSAVRIHDGSQAHALNTQLGAQAFTHGANIFFGSGKFDPTSEEGRKLLAHELTHTVQQGAAAPKKEGEDAGSSASPAPTVQPKLQVSESSDPQEQEADKVADQVTAGPAVQITKDPAAPAEKQSCAECEGEECQCPKPAEEIAAAGTGGGDAQRAIQRYTDDKQIKGEYARVSDHGHVVVLGESNYSQNLYASAEMIDSANKKLAAAGREGSYLRLVRTGDTLKHDGHVLEKVAPVFTQQGDKANEGLAAKNKGKDEDDKMSLWADCGRSSRVVMGSHGDQAPHATYGKDKETAPSFRPSDYSDQIYSEMIPPFISNPANAKFLKEGVHYTGSKDNFKQPGDPTEARKMYWELGDDGRRAFDKFAGINTAADPEVGGGYTLNTEYDMPGFKEKGDMTWNFHWAGVVMKDGTDNITLENYADGKGYDSINQDWNFQMYGTVKKGQSFNEEHLASNTHGSRGSAFAVKPDGS